jgi:hypothetical protein
MLVLRLLSTSKPPVAGHRRRGDTATPTSQQHILAEEPIGHTG